MSRRAELALLLLALLAPVARGEDALPPVEAGASRSAELSSGLSVVVREFRVRGNTVFQPEELASALAPWVGRRVDSEELLRARDALTQLYLDRGYLGSGATLPDQRVQDGIVELQVVEGQLGEIEVRGTRRLSPAWLRERVRPPADRPFRIGALEEKLQRLQRDPLVRRVDARLSPGAFPGESALALTIEEEQPWLLSAELANDISSSLGGRRARLQVAHRNLSGRGDSLRADYSTAEGLDDLELGYALPLGRWSTRLELYARHSRGEVVRGVFEDAVDSERTSYAATLVQPLLDSAYDSVELGIGGELRRGEVELFGEPIALYSSESEDDESRVSVLRVFQSWVHRSSDQVLALRLTESFGLDALDASEPAPAIAGAGGPGSSGPDGRFFAWLAQLSYARQLPRTRGIQLVARADAQLSADPLLPLERISVGGSDSVRGYPENQMVRDNALVASLELRVPVLRDPLERPVLELAPFVDFGKAWNRDGFESFRSIASAGLGIRYSPSPRIGLELYWGARLRDVDTRDAENLQDLGISARVRVAAF